MKNESFILTESSLKWIPEMPQEPKYTNNHTLDVNIEARYEEDLQSAIDSAIEVSNQEEVWKVLRTQNMLINNDSIGKIYSLLCSVEKNLACPFDFASRCAMGRCDCKTVALVTFEQPSLKLETCPRCQTKVPSDKHECNVCGWEFGFSTHSEDQPLVREENETQEQIFDDMFCKYFDCLHNQKLSGYDACLKIQSEFTITRKQQKP
jgi:hypothetical protein